MVESGHLKIDPFDEQMVQPSSIDLRVDQQFRVFHNARYPYIDVRKPMEDLTELVEVADGEPFILHPGEFVLGSTLEKVTLPNDIVGRIEGKSSLGRLGLLIHSSLPRSEPITLLEDGGTTERPIGEVVEKRIEGAVVAFDPVTFEVGFHPITGWYQGPPDRIFEVSLASGRSIRVTGGHSLFTLGRDGEIHRVRALELEPGSRVAIPRRIPDPSNVHPVLDLPRLAPESAWPDLVIEGPSVDTAFRTRRWEVDAILEEVGIGHAWFYRKRGRLPYLVAVLAGVTGQLVHEDRLGFRGSSHTLPLTIDIDEDLAWLVGLYVAEGYRRRGQVVLSNTDEGILRRVERIAHRIGVTTYRGPWSVTLLSSLLSEALSWLGVGGKAHAKRIPQSVFGWPQHLIQAFFDGLVDGDGSRDPQRTSVWTSSDGLVGDLLRVAPRLRLRAAAYRRERGRQILYQVAFPNREHKLLTAVPNPRELLRSLREEAGLTQIAASIGMGFRSESGLNNIEKRYENVRRLTLDRIRRFYGSLDPAPSRLGDLERIVDGDVAWDVVREVRDTGTFETVYDLEVRPNGQAIENFLGGHGGVFASNTAGFVDAGWSGHLTLELSNVANLPITIYPGMKIGQLCLFQLSSPAERGYGDTGKYQGQRGPTPSRFYEDFAREDEGASSPLSSSEDDG